jgi:putative nucleotidyltransferase with HDIG domain
MTLQTSFSNITLEELKDAVPRLAELLANAMKVDHCAVFVYSTDQQSTIALFRHGYDQPELRAHSWTDPLSPVSIPAEQYVLQTRKPLLRQSERDFERFPLVNPGQEIREGRIVDLTIPLIWGDKVQGTTCLWRAHDPRVFTEAEISRAVELSKLVAMTIVFAREYGEERLQRQRMNALLDVANAASSGQGIDDILQMIAGSMRAVTDCDVCLLYTFDETGDEVLASFQTGLHSGELSLLEDSSTVGVNDVPAEVSVRLTRRPRVIRDFTSELSSTGYLCGYLLEHNVSELLLVPIVWQNEMVGVAYCWYKTEGERFSHASIEAAEAIAQQGGGVVSRARLETTLKQQADESEALLRIGEAVLTSETLPPVLDEVSASLRKLIPYSYCSVAMLSEDQQYLRVIREWGDSYRSIKGLDIPVDTSISGTAVRERALVSSVDVLKDARAWKHIPGGMPLSSIMAAPLSHDNNVLGTIMIARSDSLPFTVREERLMRLLSQPAAVAIERVQARTALARRAERQAFLARVGDMLVSYQNPEQALQRVAELAVGVIADGVVIGLAGWEYGSLNWVADSFRDPHSARQLHEGLHHLDLKSLQDRLEHALVSNKAFSYARSSIRYEHRFLRDFLERLQVHHLLVVPFFQQQRAPGLMILMSQDETAPFEDDEVQLAQIVAERIGDALERLQIKLNHESLLRISEALHAQTDMDDLVRTIADEVTRILPSDQLIIADVDHAAHMFHTREFRVGGRIEVGREYFPLDEGLCGEAFRERRPILDNQADLRVSSVYRSSQERVFYRREGESAMASPLMADDEIVGMLFMNRTGHHRFTDIELETFLLFAELASAALDRTILEQHNRDLYRASTEVLAAVVDAKDPTTLRHSRNVAFYSRLLAELMELPSDTIERVELAGLLHDVGKLGIPDRVLQKPGQLSEQEFTLIKTHPDRGARILQRHPALEDLVPMVRHHHEQYDGNGYPMGLSAGEIPIGASIICVADAFDTITSERTYQRQRSPDAALNELESCAGSQFDPEVVRRFVVHLRQDPSLVRSRHTEDAELPVRWD